MSSAERFDPRKHSSVVLNYNEKLPGISMLTKSIEQPVKTFVVGPHAVPGSTVKAGTKSRPSSAPATGRKKDDMKPAFMDEKGHWIAATLPEQPRPTQTQPLTAATTMTAQIQNSMMPKKAGAVRPVSAVVSYADVSPIITGEHVRDAGGHATMTFTLGNKTAYPKASSPRSILDGPQSGYNSPMDSPRYSGGRPQSAWAERPATPTRPGSASGNTRGGNAMQQQQQKVYKGQGVGNNKAQRPQSAPRAQRVSGGGQGSTQAQGQYLVSMISHAPSGAHNQYYGPQESFKGSSARPGNRSGTIPQNTGPWTSLEPQVATQLRPGQLGQPLDHPLRYGNATNPAPFTGGQYTLRGGTYYDYPGHGDDGAAAAAAGGHEANGYMVAQGGATVNEQQYHMNGAKAGGAHATAPWSSSTRNSYFPNGGGDSLTNDDLARAHDLGKGIVAGSPNSRLVGGKWKAIPRPVEGDIVYTDYYGPFGKDMANYYGRSYHMHSAEFSKHRLVNDSAYQKIQASMMGIQALRDRPGLAMEATLVHGSPDQLATINQRNAHGTISKLHHIQEYHNLQPDRAVYNTTRF